MVLSPLWGLLLLTLKPGAEARGYYRLSLRDSAGSIEGTEAVAWFMQCGAIYAVSGKL